MPRSCTRTSWSKQSTSGERRLRRRPRRAGAAAAGLGGPSVRGRPHAPAGRSRRGSVHALLLPLPYLGLLPVAAPARLAWPPVGWYPLALMPCRGGGHAALMHAQSLSLKSLHSTAPRRVAGHATPASAFPSSFPQTPIPSSAFWNVAAVLLHQSYVIYRAVARREWVAGNPDVIAVGGALQCPGGAEWRGCREVGQAATPRDPPLANGSGFGTSMLAAKRIPLVKLENYRGVWLGGLRVPLENPVSAIVRGIDDPTRCSYRPSVDVDGAGGGCPYPRQGRHAPGSANIQSHYMIVETVVHAPVNAVPPHSGPCR